MKKIVILYSGGLDSFIMKKLADSLGYETTLVHYDIGQEYSEKEMNAIKYSKFDVDIRTVDWLKSASNTKSKDGNVGAGNIFIPGRNMVLASLAASTDLPDEVWMGGLKGEDHSTATDKNNVFINKTNELWSYVYSPFSTVPKLVFPLLEREWGKYEAVEWLYKTNKTEISDIIQTSSCLKNTKEKNCGTCIVCCRRYFIFKQLGFTEIYASHPLTNVNNINMIIEMLDTDADEDVHYDKWRRREIIPGLYLELNTKDHKKIKNILTALIPFVNSED